MRGRIVHLFFQQNPQHSQPLSLHVILMREKCLNFHQQLLLYHIRDQRPALRRDLHYQVIMSDVV